MGIIKTTWEFYTEELENKAAVLCLCEQSEQSHSHLDLWKSSKLAS